MKLQTNRLAMRWFTEQDAPFILQLVNTPGWLTYIGDRDIHTEAQAQEYLRLGPLVSYSQHGYGLYGVYLLETDTPIAMCGFVKRDTLPGPDLGFAILPQYANKGYISEACEAIMTYGRHTLQLQELYAITLPHNHSSIRVLHKLRFSPTGTQQLGDETLLVLINEA